MFLNVNTSIIISVHLTFDSKKTFTLKIIKGNLYRSEDVKNVTQENGKNNHKDISVESIENKKHPEDLHRY